MTEDKTFPVWNPPPPPPVPEQQQAKPSQKMRWVFGGVGLVLGLLIAGAGSGGQPEAITATAPTVTKTVTQQGPVVTETVAPPEAAPEPPAADDGVVAFGKTWTWDDGLQVKVSEPVAYRASNTALGGDGYKQQVVFTVTVTNKTGARFDPVLTTDITSAGREGDQIFDVAKDVSGGPDASLRDGGKVTFKIAYGVDDIKDIELQVSPDFGHEVAIFSTSP